MNHSNRGTVASCGAVPLVAYPPASVTPVVLSAREIQPEEVPV